MPLLFPYIRNTYIFHHNTLPHHIKCMAPHPLQKFPKMSRIFLQRG